MVGQSVVAGQDRASDAGPGRIVVVVDTSSIVHSYMHGRIAHGCALFGDELLLSRLSRLEMEMEMEL